MGDESTNEIPAKYCDPPILKDESGKRTGCAIVDVLTFSLDEVVNLYEYKDDNFKFYYTENDSSCDSGSPTLAVVESDVDSPPKVSIKFDNKPFVEWGINYLGKIVVEHPGRGPLFIRMIGEWTYDPAGVTTSAHASERIGGDCFSMQLGVTVAQVIAYIKGCREDFIYEIQQKTLPTIMTYHERFFLHEWMSMQVIEACYYKKEIMPYPEYLKEKVKAGELRLDNNNRTHTIEYLNSYMRFQAREISASELWPPGAFYAKMIATVQGPANLHAKIGSDAASKVVQKGTDVNYDLSKVDAPYMQQYCSYLAEAIITLSTHQDYQQADLYGELSVSMKRMDNSLTTLIESYKEHKQEDVVLEEASSNCPEYCSYPCTLL